ncbi:BadF/BadG/BcrA/BcrD ATPase family protein [Aliiglaciecola sp. 3_MG-2023]|uniref:N-acetylglucosamine kinase n=1 Tax=Aliiglaciecola sp. 3_MG-2023 TaxID=3062644 RepID=UPI0026E15C00|nr:BadF/BadG/BcrA/BcrD ATPase family protein [Aliiglaciecola sp. 3_MG-2023]MDO6693531.1 BadF/BadG/BcrA/BcrD ATPase family protein [Aliiglaciecola sp. 3_MG-2023]
MRKNLTSDDSLILGIDGGGTKCKAVLMSPDNVVLGEGTAGPGNPVYGLEQAKESIKSSAIMALQQAGMSPRELVNITLGVGLAGVNLPKHYDNIMNWQHPFKQIFLATDLLIASLGAHDGGDGAVIVSGTGSCGFSYVNQKSTILGGHGFPQGDKGSGAWFGLKAAELVLLSLDGFAKPTQLAEIMLAQLNLKNSAELTEKVAGKPASFFAQLANCVFVAADAKDELALSIVKEGADYINTMAEKLMNTHPPRMSLIGGLGRSLFPHLGRRVQHTLSAPLSSPEVGAVYFARQNINGFIPEKLVSIVT